MFWVNQPVSYKKGFSEFGFCTSVINVRKAAQKVVKLGAQKALNPCQSSYSMCEAVVLQLCNSGDRVLNLCAGLGSFEEVCVSNAINVVSIESNRDCARAAIQRLEGLPNRYKAAFMKPWKLHTCELLPVAVAENSGRTYRAENPKGFTLYPFVASGECFSPLSSGSYKPILVSRNDDLLCLCVRGISFALFDMVFGTKSFSVTRPPQASEKLFHELSDVLQHESITFASTRRFRTYNQEGVRAFENKRNLLKTQKTQVLDMAALMRGRQGVAPAPAPATPTNALSKIRSVLSPSVFKSANIFGTNRLVTATEDHQIIHVHAGTSSWPSKQWRHEHKALCTFVNVPPSHVANLFPPDNMLAKDTYPFGIAGQPWCAVIDDVAARFPQVLVCVPVGEHVLDKKMPLFKSVAMLPCLVLTGFKAVYSDTLKSIMSVLADNRDSNLSRCDPTEECLVLRFMMPAQIPAHVLQFIKDKTPTNYELGMYMLKRFSFEEDVDAARASGKPHIGSVSHVGVFPLGITHAPMNFIGPLPEGAVTFKQSISTFYEHEDGKEYFPGGKNNSLFKKLEGWHLGFCPESRAWFPMTCVDASEDPALRRFATMTKFANSPYDKEGFAPLGMLSAYTFASHHPPWTAYPFRQDKGMQLALHDLQKQQPSVEQFVPPPFVGPNAPLVPGSAASSVRARGKQQQKPTSTDTQMDDVGGTPPAPSGVAVKPWTNSELSELFGLYHEHVPEDKFEALTPALKARYLYIEVCVNHRCDPRAPTEDVLSDFVAVTSAAQNVPSVIPLEFASAGPEGGASGSGGGGAAASGAGPTGAVGGSGGGGGVGLGGTTSPKSFSQMFLKLGPSQQQSQDTPEERLDDSQQPPMKPTTQGKKRKAKLGGGSVTDDGNESDSSVLSKGSRASERLRDVNAKKLKLGG